MSWVQLHDEVWPVTDDEAELRVYIQAPDVGCPRVSWALDVSHYVEKETPPASVPARPKPWLDIDLGGLVLELGDWRRLAGLEIRADAAWHATQEFIGPYGHCHNAPRVTVHRTGFDDDTGPEIGRRHWVAHDFILRLGGRDGWSFPCELDAWLILGEEYYRTMPETPEAVARFAEGPPNLRLLTRATFVGGNVELTRRAAADPIARARDIVAGQIGCETMLQPKLRWHAHRTPDSDNFLPVPGGRSRVRFDTPGR